MKRIVTAVLLLVLSACASPGPDCPDPIDGGIGGTGIQSEDTCR